MAVATKKEGYNARLFRPGSVQRHLHMARFAWAERQLADLPARGYDMIELGCFDGRLLHHCVPPARYHGFDANWEKGLDEAVSAFAHEPDWVFQKSSRPEDLSVLKDASFQVGASLETLEHIPPDLVEMYLRELRRLVTDRLIISVPNEIGAVFALKRLTKQVMRMPVQDYTRREWFDTVRGRAEQVERIEHKGFDYRRLVDLLERYFEVTRVESVTSPHVPAWAGMTVGIVARARTGGNYQMRRP